MPADDQQDRIGDPQPVGDGGDDHDPDEETDPIGQADHRRRPSLSSLS